MNAHRQVDASTIYQGLHQGGEPPSGHILKRHGFDLLVLCAAEIQPISSELDGIAYLRVPLDDDSTVPLDIQDWRLSLRAARVVARRVFMGKKVLVTCAQGRNRSGLLSCIALHFLTHMPGPECISYIRRRRENACRNPQFNRAVSERLR